MKLEILIALIALGSSSLAVAGCAADLAPEGEDAEETAASEGELVAAQKMILGAYHFASELPGSAQPGKLRGLVLKPDGTFFADVDTGLRCVTQRCISNPRITGRYKVTAKTLTLVAVPGAAASDFFGRYRYSYANSGAKGQVLTLTRAGAGWKGWSSSLDRESTYCRQPTDCEGQIMYVPMCIGHFTCDSAASTCGFSCESGGASPIWPSDATRVVAQSSGGFMPPPPPGSECALGEKYTLDVATKALAWEGCKIVDMVTPFTKEVGQKTLTDAEMTVVDAAMKGLKLSASDRCGADKPLARVTVDSTSRGSTTYTDSFYSCAGSGPYVANISGVFAALREITGVN